MITGGRYKHSKMDTMRYLWKQNMGYDEKKYDIEKIFIVLIEV